LIGNGGRQYTPDGVETANMVTQFRQMAGSNSKNAGRLSSTAKTHQGGKRRSNSRRKRLGGTRLMGRRGREVPASVTSHVGRDTMEGGGGV